MSKLKVLVDLKPALDGYSGIPQEARLLFCRLQDLGDDFQVDGLLQQADVPLAVPTTVADAPAHERIFHLSRAVASFDQERPKASGLSYKRALENLASQYLRRWRAYRGQPFSLADFDPEFFEDFIWQRLFDKTLLPRDRGAVVSARYKLVSEPRDNFYLTALSGLTRYHRPRHLVLDTRGYDFFIAQTPLPAVVSPETTLVVRYHDSVPVFMPHTIEARQIHQVTHYNALKANVEAGALFACTSAATRSELLRIFPELDGRAAVIHNFISEHFRHRDAPKRQALEIIANRVTPSASDGTENSPKIPNDYLLVVSTLEPRKNHALVISAWERLRLAGFSELALVFVGRHGWGSEPIETLMRPWKNRGALFHLQNVPALELATLYQHASATVCPSIAEGFDYTGVEAMQCGGIVIASDIEVHREIFRDDAAYFDPYSVEDLFDATSIVLAPKGTDTRLSIQASARQSVKRLCSSEHLEQWRNLLEK